MESNFCCSNVKKERFVFLNPIKNFFKQICGYCPHHGWFLYPKKYRMNTAYILLVANFANKKVMNIIKNSGMTIMEVDYKK